MSEKNKNFIIILGMILLSVGVLLWFYVLDVGSVTVSADQNNYRITLQDQALECEVSPCKLKTKMGFYTVRVFKEGFVTAELPIEIKRFKTTEVSASLKKINQLVLLEKTPAGLESRPKPGLPPEIQADPLLTPTWNENRSRLIYLESETGLLKEYANQNSKQISTLKNLTETLTPSWSPQNDHILLLGASEAFWITPKTGSRIKIPLPFEIIKTLWHPAGEKIILTSKEGPLYSLEKNQDPLPLTWTADLDRSAWIDEKHLLTATQNNSNLQLEQINIETGERQTLLTKNNFSTSQIHYSHENKKAYLKNSNDGQWYELEF